MTTCCRIRNNCDARPIAGAGIPRHEVSLVKEQCWASIEECCQGSSPWPLLLLGNAGTGKTCAALCVLDQVAIRKYWSVLTMCEELIAVQQGVREYAEQTDNPHYWWQRYRDLDCVVVDELAARERVSDFQYETTKRAIDERHGKPAIFISNLELDRIEKAYDDRVASRLAGGTIIRFVGSDRRLQ